MPLAHHRHALWRGGNFRKQHPAPLGLQPVNITQCAARAQSTKVAQAPAAGTITQHLPCHHALPRITARYCALPGIRHEERVCP